MNVIKEGLTKEFNEIYSCEEREECKLEFKKWRKHFGREMRFICLTEVAMFTKGQEKKVQLKLLKEINEVKKRINKRISYWENRRSPYVAKVLRSVLLDIEVLERELKH